MVRKMLLAALLSMPVLAHAADTGRVAERLYHHTYLVRNIERLCAPDGSSYAVLGAPRLIYDEGLEARLVLRCNEDDDACQLFEQETEEEPGEQFAPKPMRWGAYPEEHSQDQWG